MRWIRRPSPRATADGPYKPNRETRTSIRTPLLVSVAGRIVLAFIVLVPIVCAIGFLVRLMLKYLATQMSP